MNLVLDKIALIEWKDRIGDVNREYHKLYKLESKHLVKEFGFHYNCRILDKRYDMKYDIICRPRGYMMFIVGLISKNY